MPTAASTTTQLANISMYMWTADLAKQSLFNNGNLSMNAGRNVVLMVENAALSYGIDNNLNGLDGVNNFVYQLVGSKLKEAMEVLESGSGGIVPSPSGSVSALTPYEITHTVTALESGNQTISNTDWIFLQDINEVTINNYEYQYGKDFVFNTLSGQFNFSLSGYTLQEGDVITSLGFKPVYGPSGGGSGTISLLTIYPIVTDPASITISALIGKTVSLILRGGIGSGQVITAGTPTGTEILSTTSTGTLTPSTDNQFAIGEQLTVQYY